MDLNVGNEPLCIRKKGPSLLAWNAIQPKFTRLYLQERPRLTLVEIKDTLAQEDGFDAGLHSYKLRIRQWDIHRNLKAGEKEKLAEEIDACVRQGIQPPQRVVHHRPVRHDKIVRHTRRSNKLSEPNGNVKEITVQAGEQQQRPLITQIDTLSTWVFRPACAEVGLHAMKQWYSWLILTRSNLDHGVAFRPCTWWVFIIKALSCQHKNQWQEGLALFNKGCEAYRTALDHLEPNLAVEIICLLTSSFWHPFLGFKKSIRNYMISLAALKLGQYHPLLTLISCLIQYDGRSSTKWNGTGRNISPSIGVVRKQRDFLYLFKMVIEDVAVRDLVMGRMDIDYLMNKISLNGFIAVLGLAELEILVGAHERTLLTIHNTLPDECCGRLVSDSTPRIRDIG